MTLRGSKINERPSWTTLQAIPVGIYDRNDVHESWEYKIPAPMFDPTLPVLATLSNALCTCNNPWARSPECEKFVTGSNGSEESYLPKELVGSC